MSQRFDQGGTEPGIHAFLIADVRGYTRFTQERGDEAAAELAARFARIARQGIEGNGGALVELRGDEALAVFASSRQAFRSAVSLQSMFAAETASEPSFPLGVGIGLDAGEAVPVEHGYRGGALNLAARLCSRAKAGEILASAEAVHMARKLDGIGYEDQGVERLKGLEEPVRVVRVYSEERDPVDYFSGRARIDRRPGKRPRRRRVAIILPIFFAFVLVGWLLTARGGGPASFPTGPDTVQVIDEGSGDVVGGTTLGRGAGPGPIAAGPSAVWVGNLGTQTVARIGTSTHEADAPLSAKGPPSSVAIGEGFVWIASPLADLVQVIDPDAGRIVDNVPVANATDIAMGFGSVWVTDSSGSMYRIDPDSREAVAIPLGDPHDDAKPAGVAVGNGGIWIANVLARTVTHVDPRTGDEVDDIPVEPCAPEEIAVGAGSVWATCRHENVVVRIDPATDTVAERISVAAGPSSVAIDAEGIWVACGTAGVVDRIDPESHAVTHIDVRPNPRGVAAVDGQVWVTVSG